ncbi:C40 family peptidase [Pseudonocardia sp. T1-2H]|uniref:C40 family peptidase n=1 Tax=Pseudonocardia sp. T1-2H TaxID=3128899 RepID=UPI0031015CD0
MSRLRLPAPAGLLVAVLLLATAGVAEAAPQPSSGYVGVSVATVWTSPTSPRPVDQKALTDPVDIPGWLADMTPHEQEGLTDDNLTQTQALYGQRVEILGTQGDWYEVAVPGQPNPKNPLGYPGWIPRSQVRTDPAFGALVASRPFALVDKAVTARLYADQALHRPALEISVNTRLPLLARTPGALLLGTPDGPRWLSDDVAEVYASDAAIPAPTGADLVRFASLFVGTDYLWAGRSGFGVDCSGFTSTIYQVHGITIPRDSGPQSASPAAHKVDRADLQPGDLLFYARDNGTGSIHHVAMYTGDGMMIEAYDHLTPVRITPARFDAEYWGAVRYLP